MTLNAAYPVCDDNFCEGGSGCSCPFTYPAYVPPNYPILPFSNTTCTCMFGYVGPQCLTNGMDDLIFHILLFVTN